jgi:predicted nucleic acid-binding protein
MVYVDTSVLVAMMLEEPQSDTVARWYRRVRGELACACWGVTEFASALGIKQRTGQITPAVAATAWAQFERLASHDLRLLPLEAIDFHRAATLSLDGANTLRAGDALHLACALRFAARSIATLDGAQARQARRLKFRLVAFGQ